MGMKQLSDWPAYNNAFHFVASTKYRKNLFLGDEIRARLHEIIQDIISKKEDIELIECTVAYNHIHILVETKVAPSQVGQALFGVSSRILRQEFPSLKFESENGLWGGKSWEAIKDEKHLRNCISYIQRHQPDNTKVE